MFLFFGSLLYKKAIESWYSGEAADRELKWIRAFFMEQDSVSRTELKRAIPLYNRIAVGLEPKQLPIKYKKFPKIATDISPSMFAANFPEYASNIVPFVDQVVPFWCR